MSPEARKLLIDTLEQLTESDLRSFINTYYGPSHRPANNHGRTDIVRHFIEWAQSLTGPGLDQVQKDLDDYLKIDSAKRNPKPNNLPFASLDSLFVGRGQFLSDLRTEFENLRTRNDGHFQWQVIKALGGVGKSRTAVEYAWRHAGEYTALLFVRAGNFNRLVSSLAGLAEAKCLNLNLAADMLPGEKASRVVDHLRANPGWLLILDNVDDEKAAKQVQSLLKGLSGGHVLITSRFGIWNPHQYKLHELKLLDADSATRLILEATTNRHRQASDNAEARLLAADLGYLSLALQQAVAYINASPNVTIAGYRTLWKENDKKLAGYDLTGWFEYNTDEAGELLTVMTTWLTTLDRLSPSARWWARRLAFLAPAPVPATLAETLHALDPTPDKPGWDEPRSAVAELLNYSLLDKSQADFPTIGQMHRLVQMVIREGLKPNEQTQTRLTTAAALRQAFSGDPQDHTNWPRLEPLADHVAALLGFFTGGAIAQIPATELDPAADLGFLGNQCGLMLYGQARYAAAEPLYRRALAIDEKSFGPDHPNVATGLNNLAVLLRATNRLAEAEPLYRRAWAIDEKSFGPEHPNVAIRLNNLAELLRATNRLAEAEPLYRRALAIDEKSFGPEHPNVAIRLNNLAELLRATNRLAEAEPLYRRALAILEISFGPEHPNVATGLNNLALLLQATNRLAEAELHFRRAWAIDEKSFGPEHPNVATGLNNLALLLRATNRLAEAEPLCRRAAAIFIKSLGAEHPNSITVVRNYHILLRVQEYNPEKIRTEMQSLCEETGTPVEKLMSLLLA